MEIDKPFKLWLQATQRCNLKCEYCYGDCGTEAPEGEWTNRELLDFVDSLVADDVMHVLIEGGEPFVRDDIFEVLEYSARRMLTWVRTNGTLINESAANRLKAIGVETVIVDLMGATAETHERLTGEPGSFERCLQGIKNLLAEGNQVLVATIVTRVNLHEIQDLVNLAGSLGVHRVGVLRLYPQGRARRNWQSLSAPLSEQMQVIGSLEAPPGVTIMQSWHPNDGNCCWQNAGVNALGRSVGCPYLRESVDYGDARKESLAGTWDHPLWVQLRGQEVDHECPECSTSQRSRGGCRSTAYAFHGSWTAPDPYCTTMNGGVDLSVLPADI